MIDIDNFKVINDKHIRHASLEADNKLYLSKKNGKNQYSI